MPALYSHTTRAIGTTLTASIYNADHQNHITNGIPSKLDDYSASVAEMQTAADPGELGTESQAGTLAGELERLRFAIKEIKQLIDGGITQWYETPQPLTSTLRFPPWYIEGLEIKVAPSSPAFIEVATGYCRDAANTIDMVVSSALARTVTALWVSAAGGGGVGVTWLKFVPYHTFVVKTAASTFDIGFDTAINAANLLARVSGTKYRRVGTANTTTTPGTMRLCVQYGDEVVFNDAKMTNPSFVAKSATAVGFVKLIGAPTGFSVKARIHAWATDVGGWLFTNFYTVSGNLAHANQLYGATSVTNTFAGAHQVEMLWTNTSGEVRFSVGGFPLASGVNISLLGYKDLRR